MRGLSAEHGAHLLFFDDGAPCDPVSLLIYPDRLRTWWRAHLGDSDTVSEVCQKVSRCTALRAMLQ